MNRKTRPICHGRMGKGNNRCSRVIVRVLAESLLGAVKSKANRDVTIRRLPFALLLLQFQCTKLRINLVGNGNWNTAIPVQVSCGYQFWHRLGEFKWRRSVMRIVVVMLCVYCILWCVRYYVFVAYLLSVNLLHMYTVFVALSVAHFPLKE